MATTFKSDFVTNSTPQPQPTNQSKITVYATIALTAAQVVATNVLQFFVLPAGCRPLSYIINSDDLDSDVSPTVEADFGILNSTGDGISTATVDGGNEWIDGGTFLQAAALLPDTDSVAAYEVLKAVQAVDYDRIVAIVITASPTADEAGTIGVELSYAQA